MRTLLIIAIMADVESRFVKGGTNRLKISIQTWETVHRKIIVLKEKIIMGIMNQIIVLGLHGSNNNTTKESR